MGHTHDPKYFFPFQRYNDTNLFCVVFIYELASRKDRSKVVINTLCSGMMNTATGDVLPIYLRAPISMVKAIRARSIQQGVWLILNTMVLRGPKSYGESMPDKDIQP